LKYPHYMAIFLSLILAAPLAAASVGSTGTHLPQRAPMSAKDKATHRYDVGIKHRDRATIIEQQVSAASNGKKVAALQKKLAKEYNKSITAFEKAIKFFPRYYEVHVSLGQVLHKVGRIDESLAAYDEALKINPSYDNAVAYRAEAYLELNRLDDAKEAYLTLADSERSLASQLHAAMSQWVTKQRNDSQGIDPAVVDQFANWLDGRSDIKSASQ